MTYRQDPGRSGTSTKRAVIVALALVADVALSVAPGCQGCQGPPPPDARIADAGEDADEATGTVSLASSMVDLSGSTVGCDLIDPGETILRMANLSGSASAEVSLPCSIGAVVSPPIPAGMYGMTPELYSDGVLLSSAPEQRNVIVWSGTNTPLLPAKFVVDDSGSLSVSITAQPATKNCQPATSGGAGITTNTIILTHASGECAPITMIRKRDGVSVGQYEVNCNTPMVTSCVESNEELTASGVASGSYTIRVRGRVRAIDCWFWMGPLRIPAGGKSTTAALILSNPGELGCR